MENNLHSKRLFDSLLRTMEEYCSEELSIKVQRTKQENEEEKVENSE